VRSTGEPGRQAGASPEVGHEAQNRWSREVISGWYARRRSATVMGNTESIPGRCGTLDA
jgi:hypothetical protein